MCGLDDDVTINYLHTLYTYDKKGNPEYYLTRSLSFKDKEASRDDPFFLLVKNNTTNSVYECNLKNTKLKIRVFLTDHQEEIRKNLINFDGVIFTCSNAQKSEEVGQFVYRNGFYENIRPFFVFFIPFNGVAENKDSSYVDAECIKRIKTIMRNKMKQQDKKDKEDNSFEKKPVYFGSCNNPNGTAEVVALEDFCKTAFSNKH